MNRKLQIGDRIIGDDYPCMIIAEAGANCNSNIEIAIELIDRAAEAGADCIKFQHYVAEKLVTKIAPKYYVDTMEEFINSSEPKGFQYDEFQLLDGLTQEQWRKIFDYCQEKKILFLSTPFDFENALFLNNLGMSAFKIASADITYLPFIKYVAEFKKPIILSTGASTLEEILRAVNIIRKTGNNQIAILQCTLHYPCHNNEVNLGAIDILKEVFPDYCVGLSDHSLGILVPLIAAARGANIIEKHYTIDKTLADSTDHFMSVNPIELKNLVEQVKEIPSIIGKYSKKPDKSEKNAILYARRSLTSACEIKKGDRISLDKIIFKRPGTGIQPYEVDKIIGKIINIDIPYDTTITWEMLE